LVKGVQATLGLKDQKDEEISDVKNDRRNGNREFDESENEREDKRNSPRKSCLLTFKDVEDSIDTFSSDNGKNVKRWIKDFEDTAKLCPWNDVQEMIYAKKMLRGSARLFVRYYGGGILNLP
jgi:hypothetical protein